jgi:hypothetical protein
VVSICVIEGKRDDIHATTPTPSPVVVVASPSATAAHPPLCALATVASPQRVVATSRCRRAALSTASPLSPCDGPVAVGPVRIISGCCHWIRLPGRRILRIRLWSRQPSPCQGFMDSSPVRAPLPQDLPLLTLRAPCSRLQPSSRRIHPPHPPCSRRHRRMQPPQH